MKDEFEDQLRGALRRRYPSPGFTERVIARAAPPERRFKPFWAVAAIAAVLVVSILSTQEYQRRQAEDARRQALLALSITAEKLNLVRNIVLKENQ